MKKTKGFGNQPKEANNPSNQAESAYELGVSLMLQEDLEGALHALSQAVTAKTNHPEAYTYLGIVCRQLGTLDLPEIADLFRQSLTLRNCAKITFPFSN